MGVMGRRNERQEYEEKKRIPRYELAKSCNRRKKTKISPVKIWNNSGGVEDWRARGGKGEKKKRGQGLFMLPQTAKTQ